MPTIVSTLICVLVVIVVVALVIVLTGYKKAPPDTAFIISGVRKKIIIGKASVKIPFFFCFDNIYIFYSI